MEYEMFLQVTPRKLVEHLPPGCKKCRFTVERYSKRNGEFLCIWMNLEEKGEMVPNDSIIDLRKFYDRLEHGERYEALLCEMAEIICFSKDRDNFNSTDSLLKLEHLVFTLVSTEKNRKLLETIPHRKFLDLSVCCQLEYPAASGKVISVRLTNEMIQNLGIDEDELFTLAEKNTKIRYPAEIKPMLQMVRELFPRRRLPSFQQSFEQGVFNISNAMHWNGAVNLLFEERLFALAGQMNSDFYLVPFSVHEVIAVREQRDRLYSLKEMIRRENQTVRLPGDFLSNEIYHYARRNRAVTIL